MLTKTSITAIQVLVLMTQLERDVPVSPQDMARRLDASTTYLSKIHTQLVKAGILQSHRGTRGGVTLARDPRQIQLLEIVEACQGRFLGDYCAPHDDLKDVCAFHHAMHELQAACTAALARWTLADLASRPEPAPALRDKVRCRMVCAHRT